MQQRLYRNLLIIVNLIVAVIFLSGCSSSASAASGTIETGTVTESTLTDTVESSGTVSAKQIATLTWGTSGDILEVKVQNNDTVSTGEELMKLQSTSAPTDVLEAISTLVSAKEKLTNVQNSKTSLAQAEVDLLAAQIAYNDAMANYYTLGQPIGSAEYISILKNQYLSAQRNLSRATGQYNRMADLDENDPKRASAYANLAQARIDVNDALTRLNHFSNPPTASDAKAIKSNLDLAKAQLDSAQQTYDEIKAGNTQALIKAQAAVDAAQTTVNELSIIAPFDGQVAVVYSQTGDLVGKGTKALVLVDRSEMYIDVLVAEDSIQKVQVGNAVEISFSGLGIDTTGKVKLVNPVGATSSGVTNYTVRVALDTPSPEILIGATASVVITTGDPHSVLFVPVSAVLTDAQGEYVTTVNTDGSTARVGVTTGDISNEEVAVTGDLTKGELVQLYTTAASTTSTTKNNRGGLFGLGNFLR
jgi:RND family efflux transporter MFP subunit